MNGMIADIQRMSLHDGPGLRTTVFLKGCPLHCAWCHNPECIAFEPEMMFYPDRCIHCGKCDEGCFSGARAVCGRRMSPREVLEEILRDREYYGFSGGVTFSGGEPLAQPDFLLEAILLCREQNIHCAIETSLFLYREEILKKLDLVIADLKLWDDGEHRRFTGVSNKGIREHFRALDSLGVPIIIRTPVIVGINADPEKIAPIAEFAAGMKNVIQYELLPYHPLGNTKRTALGMKPESFSAPDAVMMKELNTYAFIR